MDTLPTELIIQILVQVPRSSLSSCRLVSRSFSVLAFPLLFSHIPQWLSYTFSHQAVIALSHDVFNRPAVMWSPWATGTSLTYNFF